jgi:hypothetical protein
MPGKVRTIMFNPLVLANSLPWQIIQASGSPNNSAEDGYYARCIVHERNGAPTRSVPLALLQPNPHQGVVESAYCTAVHLP